MVCMLDVPLFGGNVKLTRRRKMLFRHMIDSLKKINIEGGVYRGIGYTRARSTGQCSLLKFLSVLDNEHHPTHTHENHYI